MITQEASFEIYWTMVLESWKTVPGPLTQPFVGTRPKNEPETSDGVSPSARWLVEHHHSCEFRDRPGTFFSRWRTWKATSECIVSIA